MQAINKGNMKASVTLHRYVGNQQTNILALRVHHQWTHNTNKNQTVDGLLQIWLKSSELAKSPLHYTVDVW